VRGTAAAGTLGPDLTHVASRRFIGAGLLPNDPARLAEWIARSQHLKPGNLMPSFDDLAADELRGLAAYLAGLE
jgi:cytochrome c oxidase subunit 2